MTESVDATRDGSVASAGADSAGRIDAWRLAAATTAAARRLTVTVLTLAGRSGRLLRFLAVGASGVVVNVAVMAALVQLGVHYLAASLVATEVSIVWNFLLHERIVFADRRGGSRWWHRLLKSLTYNNVEYAARVPLLVLAVSVLHVPETVAQGVTLILAFALRFVFVNRVVYGTSGSGSVTADEAVAPALSRD